MSSLAYGYNANRCFEFVGLAGIEAGYSKVGDNSDRSEKYPDLKMCIRDRAGRCLTACTTADQNLKMLRTGCPVSYTHLDVYKRQGLNGVAFNSTTMYACSGIEYRIKSAKKSLLPI